MSETEASLIKRLWDRYKILILICVVLYLLGMAALMFFSSGEQTEPFIYQVF